MPGPIALEQEHDGWSVACWLCDDRSAEPMAYEAADDLAYDHVVAAHPEVTEP